MCRNLFWGCLSFQLLWDHNVTDFRSPENQGENTCFFFHCWLLRPLFVPALGWESLNSVPTHKEPMIWEERSVYSVSGKKIWPKHCVDHSTYFLSDSPIIRSGYHWACQVALVVRTHLRRKRYEFSPWEGMIPWRRAWSWPQYSCLENHTDRGAWHSFHSVAESDATEAT